jgi:hypothetical protein
MKHKEKHSNDDRNFAIKWHPILKEAASDLSFLLGRGYRQKYSLAIVGNGYRLNKRQQRTLSLITRAVRSLMR